MAGVTSRMAVFGRGVLRAVLTLVMIAVFSFVLVHAAPGDPVAVLAGQSGAVDAAMIASVRADYGLDKPYVEQLWTHLWRMAQFDFGMSHRHGRPVIDMVIERLPASVLLMAASFLIAVILGVVLGVVSALRQSGPVDTTISVGFFMLYAIPAFWLGLMLILVFSVFLEWLPPFGYESVGAGFTGWRHQLDVLYHLVLPGLTLGLVAAPLYGRLMRGKMIEIAREPFIRAAHAKGLSGTAVLLRHALPNALLPVIALAGVHAAALVGGSVVVETVFAWPGIGRLTFDAIADRNYPLLLGVLFVSSALVVAINIATDWLSVLIDPRLRGRA